MSEIRAISFSQKQCGKHLSDTKKRFVWDFQIDGKHYTLELVNSTLSGKRTVILNMDQIYHQKKQLFILKISLLNIDFDFTHNLQGHILRISRIQETINKFQLRIDNRTFDQIRLGVGKFTKNNSGKDFSKKSNDPFADFENFASNSTAKENNSNAFGDFDFDSFSKPNTSTSSAPKVQQKSQSNASNGNLLDMGFGQTSKTQKIPVNDFQTNAFQTKSPNGFDDFLQGFKQNEANLLDDQNQFSTNAYVNRNHYMDLQGWGKTSEQYVSDGVQVPVQQPKNRTIKQNLMEYNKMATLATKKAANTVAMKFNEIKKTINESLI